MYIRCKVCVLYVHEYEHWGKRSLFARVELLRLEEAMKLCAVICQIKEIMVRTIV